MRGALACAAIALTLLEARHRGVALMRGALACAAIALTLLAARPAVAQTVGVSFDRDGRLARRLAAELRTRGYDTRDLVGAGATSQGELDALVWAHDDPPLVRICVAADPRAPRCEVLTDADESVLLIRAVEVVRAHLGEPGAHVEAPRPEAPPPPERTDRWTVGLAASVLVPASGLSTGAAAAATLGFSPHPWIGLELGGLVSLVDPAVEDASGTASASSRLVWLGADVQIPEDLLAGHRLRFGLAAALSGAELHVSAAPAFEARQGAFTALMLMARASFVLRLVDRVGLEVGARVGAAVPQPVILFDEREVARWGAPFVSVELGIVFGL